jgi:hypothetical protein
MHKSQLLGWAGCSSGQGTHSAMCESLGLIQTQKYSPAFLYISNKQAEFKIKENSIYITLAPPKVKYFGINLTKYLQDLCGEKLQISDQKLTK